MKQLDHFLKSDKKHIKEVLDTDLFSNNNVVTTLKSVFAPTPQVAQQRREAVGTFVQNIAKPVATTRSDMVGSTAMVAGRTLAQQAVISKGTGALTTKIPTLDKRNDMVGSISAGLITGRATQTPIQTMITTSKSNPSISIATLNLPGNKSLSWSTATPERMLEKESARLLPKEHLTAIRTPVWKPEGMVKPTTIHYGDKYTGSGRVLTPTRGAKGEQLREGIYWDSGEYRSPAGKRYSWGAVPMYLEPRYKDGTLALEPMGGVKSLPFEAISTIPSGYTTRLESTNSSPYPVYKR